MMQPVRSYSSLNTYRYGFNGKENDNDVKGEGNQQDYGMRIYDTRLGKFLSIDPLTRNFPWYSPYHSSGNNPIRFIDLDGCEPEDAQENWVYKPTINVKTGEREWDPFTYNGPKLSWITYNAIFDKVTKQYWFINQGNDGQWYYWKHNPGADQTTYIAGGGADNGSWTRFIPYTKPNPADLLTAMTVGPLVLIPGLTVTAPVAAMLPEATAGERTLNVTIDYTSQVNGNFAGGKRGWDAFSDINATSIILSAANPGSSWGRLGFNNSVSSFFSVSTTRGYNGIGGGKNAVDASLQAALSTILGRVTRGIDLKTKSLNVRLNYANKTFGSNSSISQGLQTYIRNNQLLGATLGIGTGGVTNSLNNTLEKKDNETKQ